MKIVLLGDLHGNFTLTYNVLSIAKDKFDFNTIIQAGDFGMWAESLTGKHGKALNYLSDMALIYFVRGNHEEYSRNGMPFFSNYENVIVPTYMLDFLTPPIHIDGQEITIENIKFLGIGGAYSIDWKYRTEGKTLWQKEERVNKEICLEVMSAISHKTASPDIIVTHDVPTTAHYKIFPYEAIETESEYKHGSKYLEDLYNMYQPKIWLHGHYHKQYFTYDNITNTLFIGLPMIEDGYATLDTEQNIIEFRNIKSNVTEIIKDVL